MYNHISKQGTQIDKICADGQHIICVDLSDSDLQKINLEKSLITNQRLK